MNIEQKINNQLNKVPGVKKAIKRVYQRLTSLSNNTKLDEADMVKAFSILEDELGSKYPEELKEKSVTDILYGALLMMCKSGKSKKEIVAYIDSYEKKYPSWEKSEIIKHLGRAKETFLKMAKARNVLGMKVIAMVHSFIISRG